jgi:hypothetical protein
MWAKHIVGCRVVGKIRNYCWNRERATMQNRTMRGGKLFNHTPEIEFLGQAASVRNAVLILALRGIEGQTARP